MCICGGKSVLYSKVSPSIYEFKPCPICNYDMQAWDKELQVIKKILGIAE